MKVGLRLPSARACAGRVASCDGRGLVLELLDEVPPGALEEGSVMDLFMPLSWGMYKWLCIVTCFPGGDKAEIELLDAPIFIQRRLDPRVGVGLPAQVRRVRGANRSQAHEAVVADLSRGGLKLEHARQLRAGDLVDVSLDLSATLAPPSGPVTLVGRVVMAYPTPPGNDPATTDAHVSFLEAQEAGAIGAVDRFVAQQLEGRWED